VRIEDIVRESGLEFFYFFIPAWDSHAGFRLPVSVLPERLAKPDTLPQRLHAFVNLGAESAEALFFDGWEK
jgi:hypothetical protein